MSRFVLAIAAAGLVLAGCAAPRACPSRYPAGTQRASMVWDIGGPSSRVMMVGTYHAASSDDLPDAARSAIGEADLLVVEAAGPRGDFRERNRARRDALLLPPGESLRRMLGDSDFEFVVEHVPPDRDEVDRLRPWVAASLLVKGAFVFPVRSLVDEIRSVAAARGLPVRALDSWERQLALLDTQVGLDELRLAIRGYPRLACGIQRDLDAFRVGDVGHFERAQPRRGVMAIASGARNDEWARRIADHAWSGRRVVVAISVSNIVGPSGIAQRLVDSGLAVTRR